MAENHDDPVGYYHAVLDATSYPDAPFDGDASARPAISTRYVPRYHLMEVDMHAAVLEHLESLLRFLRLSSKQIWFDLDEEADVLYVSVERPQGATDSDPSKDGILMRYRGDRLAGVTILDARKRLQRPG